MKPNVSAAPFIPMALKSKSFDPSGRRPGPIRKISAAGKANIVFAESRYKTVSCRCHDWHITIHFLPFHQELCRQFEELNECEYGDRCLFAHSVFELKVCPCNLLLLHWQFLLSLSHSVIPSSGQNVALLSLTMDSALLVLGALSSMKRLMSRKSWWTFWRTFGRTCLQKKRIVCQCLRRSVPAPVRLCRVLPLTWNYIHHRMYSTNWTHIPVFIPDVQI